MLKNNEMIKNFNVWPAEMFDWVEEFLHESIKNKTLILPHRWLDFAKICENTDNEMKEFFNIPDNYKIFYTYSATEWMEIIIKNLVDKNISHIINWDFWDLFIWESKSLKKEVDFVKKNRWERVEIDEIILKSGILTFTANDTSTGIEYSPIEMKQIREKFNDKLIIADATSSFWALNYDINSADAWIFSVQKNFWLPPWLGVIIVNEKVIEKSFKLENDWYDVWWHHKISSFLKFKETNHTPSTPNILVISALWFVVNQFKKVFWNIENLEKHTLEKAEYFYENIKLKPLYNWKSGRSKTTFVLSTSKEENKEIFKKLALQWFSVSPWYSIHKEENIRIANFPVHKMEDIKKIVELLNK